MQQVASLPTSPLPGPASVPPSMAGAAGFPDALALAMQPRPDGTPATPDGPAASAPPLSATLSQSLPDHAEVASVPIDPSTGLTICPPQAEPSPNPTMPPDAAQAPAPAPDKPLADPDPAAPRPAATPTSRSRVSHAPEAPEPTDLEEPPTGPLLPGVQPVDVAPLPLPTAPPSPPSATLDLADPAESAPAPVGPSTPRPGGAAALPGAPPAVAAPAILAAGRRPPDTDAPAPPGPDRVSDDAARSPSDPSPPARFDAPARPIADPSPRPAPAPPASQLAPALASFATTSSHPTGPHQLIIRLDPAELGRVEFRIERPGGGPARIELSVERPETLLLLIRDQPQLHRALDLAGVPPADRTLHFTLAAPPPGAPPAGTDPGHQHRPHHPHPGAPNTARTDDAPDPHPDPGNTVWRRAGVDITA